MVYQISPYNISTMGNSKFTNKVLDFFSSIAAMMLGIYLFFSQINFSFNVTLFLYSSFVCILICIFFRHRIIKDVGLSWFCVITFITYVGTIYSNNETEAIRQSVFWLVFVAFLIEFQEKGNFKKIIIKFILFIPILALISVYIQFFTPNIFNKFAILFLRLDRYEQLIWSFKVNGAYSGFFGSVSEIAFSMAILFGYTLKKLLKHNSINTETKSFLLNLGLQLLSLFGIILSKKRGMIIAVIIATILAFLCDKDIQKQKVAKKQFIFIFVIIIFLIILFSNFIVNNEYVKSFINRFFAEDITTGRIIFYNNAWNSFIRSNTLNILFGKGTATSYLINNTGLHNIYLQILYDHGLLGLIIYLIFFINNFIYSKKHREFLSMFMQLIFFVYGFSGNPLYDTQFFVQYLFFTKCEL